MVMVKFFFGKFCAPLPNPVAVHDKHTNSIDHANNLNGVVYHLLWPWTALLF